MIRTKRIASGFDVELQLGAGWFLTALTQLHDNNVLFPGGLPPPGSQLKFTSVTIIFDPNWDLRINVEAAGIPRDLSATLRLNHDGTTLDVATNQPGIGMSIPFGVFPRLAEPPVMVKVQGDSDHADAIAFLANLDIEADPQSAAPRNDGTFLERGDPTSALSFLPLGKDNVFGLGELTFGRLANNIWHTSLRAPDGSHPLPSATERNGDWTSVTMSPLGDRIQLVLKGEVPIDYWPDGEVAVIVTLKPSVAGGHVTLSMDVDANIDTGLLADLFAFLIGGILGFFVGLVAGGLGGALIGTAIGGGLGVIVLESGEAIVEGSVERRMKALLDGKPLPLLINCENGIAQIAERDPAVGFNLSLLDAVPTSIAIFTDRPDALHRRSLLITSNYDELKIDNDGLAFAGVAGVGEVFQPVPARLIDATYVGDDLVALKYASEDGQVVTLSVAEVVNRIVGAELKPPLRLSQKMEGTIVRVPAGKLPTVCLTPTAIQRKDTIVTSLKFSSGATLRVADAIALQDAGALVVAGYQLIHPRSCHAYYRAKADKELNNNLESLPTF